MSKDELYSHREYNRLAKDEVQVLNCLLGNLEAHTSWQDRIAPVTKMFGILSFIWPQILKKIVTTEFPRSWSPHRMHMCNERFLLVLYSNTIDDENWYLKTSKTKSDVRIAEVSMFSAVATSNLIPDGTFRFLCSSVEWSHEAFARHCSSQLRVAWEGWRRSLYWSDHVSANVVPTGRSVSVSLESVSFPTSNTRFRLERWTVKSNLPEFDTLEHRLVPVPNEQPTISVHRHEHEVRLVLSRAHQQWLSVSRTKT